MVEDLEKKLLGGMAYRIFVDELTKHLGATQTLFKTTSWTAEELQEASGRFHTIRGGAGFFRLTKIASVAGELEKLLGENSPEDLVGQIDKLRELDSSLRNEAGTIPAPAIQS